MSLRETLTKAVTKQCAAKRFSALLKPAQAKEYEEILDDTSVGCATLASALMVEYPALHPPSDQSIRRHRIRSCSCYRETS